MTREVLEETGLSIRVDRLIIDCPAEPADGTYRRWRTYQCSVTGGEAAAGGGEGANAELIDIMWLSLDDERRWPAGIRDDPFLAPQLHAIRDAVRNDAPSSRSPAG